MIRISVRWLHCDHLFKDGRLLYIMKKCLVQGRSRLISYKATTNNVCIQKVETDVNNYVRSNRFEGLRYPLVDGESDTNMTNGIR